MSDTGWIVIGVLGLFAAISVSELANKDTINDCMRFANSEAVKVACAENFGDKRD